MAALKTYRARVRKEDETDFAAVTKKYAAATIEDARARAENDGFVVLSIKEVDADDPDAPGMSVRSSSLILTIVLSVLVSVPLSLMFSAAIFSGPKTSGLDLGAGGFVIGAAWFFFYAIALWIGSVSARPAILSALKAESWSSGVDSHPLWYAFRLGPFFIIFLMHITITLAAALTS